VKIAVWALVASENGEVDDFLNVAARECFFKLDETTLSNLASRKEIAIPRGPNLFDALFALLKAILGDDEAQLFKHCRERLAACEERQQWADELVELDDAA
jgi:hypothetical protein